MVTINGAYDGGALGDAGRSGVFTLAAPANSSRRPGACVRGGCARGRYSRARVGVGHVGASAGPISGY